MSDAENQNDEPKIVVDDDYKSRVEQEKEQLRQQMEEAAEAADAAMPMPPASFPVLITTLATQALSSMGQLPDPLQGKPVIQKPLAKHLIDTLAVLEEKTKGNLSQDEAEMLEGTLHQLRMIYVSTPESAPQPPENETPGSSLELPT